MYPLEGPHWITTAGANTDIDFQWWTNKWSAVYKPEEHFVIVDATNTTFIVQALQYDDPSVVLDTLSLEKGVDFSW